MLLRGTVVVVVSALELEQAKQRMVTVCRVMSIKLPSPDQVPRLAWSTLPLKAKLLALAAHASICRALQESTASAFSCIRNIPLSTLADGGKEEDFHYNIS